jgi:hypothetical protein
MKWKEYHQTNNLNTSQIESAALQERLNTSQIESAALQERLRNSQIESAALQERLRNSQTESAALQERLRNSQTESAALQERLRTSQTELATLRTSQTGSAVLQARLRRENESLRERLGQLERFSQKTPQPDITQWNVPRSDVLMIKEIGRGAWGTVMRGRCRGEAVAVKLPHQDILNRRLLERLKRETRVMIQICHPNLVRIVAAVFDRDAEQLRQPPLIITELLDLNLRQCYLRRRLDPNSRIPIFLDIAYGLHYLHTCQEPIIHRDVSAPNVLLKAFPNRMWRAKVSDFGSANLAIDSVTVGEGALIYTAPEAFPPRDPTSPRPRHTTKIDVYSFGILMCEVITEEQPNPELYRERLRQVRRLSGPMHSLIVGCTDQDPNRRPTMAAVINELNRVTL